MAVQTDAQRHLHRSSSLLVLDVQLRAARDQELDDVVRSLRAKMQRRVSRIAHGVHVRAGRHQHLHGLQEFSRGCEVGRKSTRAISKARGEHQRCRPVLLLRIDVGAMLQQ